MKLTEELEEKLILCSLAVAIGIASIGYAYKSNTSIKIAPAPQSFWSVPQVQAVKISNPNALRLKIYDATTEVTPDSKERKEYIKRFAKVAVDEHKRFGIPASITLAQGILESKCGKSKLATSTNNHFGIKCFSKRCKKGHCKNFTDDSHKDFFKVFNSPWESYREHSKFLTKYKMQGDYKAWANGLQTNGYATHPKYAEMIIGIIEDCKLYNLDKI